MKRIRDEEKMKITGSDGRWKSEGVKVKGKVVTMT
jgi:hypothetical protein